jgi:hypothetical protein
VAGKLRSPQKHQTVTLLSSNRPAAAQSTISADPGIKPNAPLDPNRPLAQELVTSTRRNLLIMAVGSLTLSSPDGPLPAFDSAIVTLATPILGTLRPLRPLRRWWRAT